MKIMSHPKLNATLFLYSWTKTSLSLFESLQQLHAENWDFTTAFSAVILLRSCCATITRPVDSFFKKMISILEDVSVYSNLIKFLFSVLLKLLVIDIIVKISGFTLFFSTGGRPSIFVHIPVCFEGRFSFHKNRTNM